MKNQNGFSLIEIMVGITIGMVVLAGAGTMFFSTFRANLDNVKQQRFEQSVQVLMSTMAANIRRAGYSVATSLTPQANGQYFHAQVNCITFSYEMDGAERFYGYKVENKSVYAYDQPKASGNANCVNLTNWVAMTETNSLEVTAPSAGAVFVGTGTTALVSIHIGAKAIGLSAVGGGAALRDIVFKVAVRNWSGA